MPDHVNVDGPGVRLLDLSSNTTAARGVDAPSGSELCSVYLPADAVIQFQVGVGIEDGVTDISAAGGPLPTGTWIAIPCRLSDAPGAEAGRPTVYFQGNANFHYRFTAGGIG